MSIVLVCGGRDYRDWDHVHRVLDALDPRPTCIVHGGARGVDGNARAWALNHAVPCVMFEAPWDAVGLAAGPMRNGWMLRFMRPNYVLAFPGGCGTANMVAQARAAGVEVRDVGPLR